MWDRFPERLDAVSDWHGFTVEFQRRCVERVGEERAAANKEQVAGFRVEDLGIDFHQPVRDRFLGVERTYIYGLRLLAVGAREVKEMAAVGKKAGPAMAGFVVA